MARQVLPIVGAVVGAYFGYPQLGMVIGGLIGGAIDPAINKGPSLGELPVQSSNEGFPRAIIYGTATCTGYILAFGPPLKTTETVNGEKGAPKSEQEVVYRNYAIAICEGPIGGVLRVWENDKLVFDVRQGSQMMAESALWMQNKFLHLGDESQMPNALMEQTITGVGTTPAYRGTAYMYFNLEDLTDTRGAIKQYRWEVASALESLEVIEPLVINPWTINEAGRPVHGSGGNSAMLFTAGVSPGATWDNFPDAAIGNAAAYEHYYTVIDPNPVFATAAYSTTYIGYRTDNTETINALPGGANILFEDAQQAIYRMAFQMPASFFPAIGNCTEFNDSFDSTPRYTEIIGGYNPSLVIAESSSSLTIPGFEYAINCFTGYGYINFVAALMVDRLPSPRDGLLLPTVITGTAKQLCNIEYRDDLLYQNALGPVLLPDDPNYNNDSFWDDARAAAIADGTMHADVTPSPVVVSSYVVGYVQSIGEAAELADIVSDLHQRSAIDAGDYDVSELTDMVSGLTLAGDYTAASAIDTLRTCYFFDKSEPGDKLYYPKRGKPVVATIIVDDLVELPDLSKREQVIELPKKVHLMFQNPIAGYAPVKSTYERSSVDVLTVAESSVQVPVVLSMDDGQRLVHKMMKVSTADAQGEVKLTLPDAFLRLVPSDCIGLSLRGQVRRLRIDEVSMQDGLIELTCRIDRQSAYTSDLTGIAIPEPTLPPSTIIGDTEFVYADVSSRVDSEDDLNYLVAGSGSLPGWYGWLLQRSLDGGANYSNVQQFNGADIIGELLEDVDDADENYTDTTNKVTVRLLRTDHELESITESQFLSEGGAFILEKPDGTFEIMQYRDSSQDSSGDFILSHLTRGRLNSGTSNHLAGAKFVVLSSAHHIQAQSAWIGQTLTHRAVSLGESPEAAAERTDVYVGRSQIEWPVASLSLSRVADTVTASWSPRHRFGTDDSPVASSNFRGFRVSIVGTGTITFDTTAETFTQDVSSIGGIVTVTIQALNRITGPGPATSETI